jgi:hypothetical protein
MGLAAVVPVAAHSDRSCGAPASVDVGRRTSSRSHNRCDSRAGRLCPSLCAPDTPRKPQGDPRVRVATPIPTTAPRRAFLKSPAGRARADDPRRYSAIAHPTTTRTIRSAVAHLLRTPLHAQSTSSPDARPSILGTYAARLNAIRWWLRYDSLGDGMGRAFLAHL